MGPPSLFEALIANSVLVWCVSTLEQRSWRRCLGGLKAGPRSRHRIQPVAGPVLDPRAKETCLKRSQKVDPLEIKSGPPWRFQFWSLHCGKSVEAFISSWSWFDQEQLRVEAWTGEAHFCAPAFSYVLRSKKRVPSLSCCFVSISIGLRPSRPASKPASKLALRCFVLFSMVSGHWSSRLALRPAFNFVSSYKLSVLLQFPWTWSLEACLEAVPLRQLRPKILARQDSCQLLQVQPCWDFSNSVI